SYYAYGGDFGEKYFDDFTIKGIVASDGRPKAAIYECKHVCQPVTVTWADSVRRILRISNRNAVQSLAAYTPVLVVRQDGKEVVRKQLPVMQLAAGKDTTIQVNAWLPGIFAYDPYGNVWPPAEGLLDIHFLLSDDKPWAAKGFEVAEDQLALTPVVKASQLITKRLAAQWAVKQSETDKQYIISGKGFRIAFDKTDGALASYTWKGEEQVFQPLLPHFSRPVTDNDHRGWKSDRRLKEWYEPGLKLESISAPLDSAGTMTIRSRYSLIDGRASVVVRYRINNDGVVHVLYDLLPGDGLPNLPKVGMQCGIKRAYDQISWYGRGPLENYVDRRSGFEAAIYRLPLADFMEPYVVPQENGNHTDVRWMYLHAGAGQGLLVVADSLLSMSAWPWTEANIVAARHTNKLKDAGYITLNIDLAQMGVGGNDSWSEVAQPLPQYQLPARPYHYGFYLQPYAGRKAGDEGIQAKRIFF
ncbi:MAG: DUF4981 domain-containing protein, partial [Bacteroidetes bacterium]|nr:DUF4981 domain-containing protein [Bacteroidota bacterium]